MSQQVIQISADAVDAEQIQPAAELMRSGGLVVFPTETVYGVGASVLSDTGLSRLFAVKQRPMDKPFTLHIADPGELSDYVDLQAQSTARRLAVRTMPGPITIIVQVSEQTIEQKMQARGWSPAIADRLYSQQTIGLRCPDHPVALALLSAVGQPVVASSANLPGRTPPTDGVGARASIGDQVDLLIDGGPCRHAGPSTIVRITGHRARVIREGVYDQHYIDRVLQRELLFVCSGNTCRSPMAEALARQALDELGLSDQVRVASAGTFAMDGVPVSLEAVAALRQMDIDVAGHRSQALTLELIRRAEVIYCMTRSHRQAVCAMDRSAVDKTVLLDAGGDVMDPIGQPVEVYLQTARQIKSAIADRFQALDL